jgi:hypothetical protein
MTVGDLIDLDVAIAVTGDRIGSGVGVRLKLHVDSLS